MSKQIPTEDDVLRFFARHMPTNAVYYDKAWCYARIWQHSQQQGDALLAKIARVRLDQIEQEEKEGTE